MIKIPYILADTYVTFVVDGQQVTFDSNEQAFEKAIKAIHDSDDATIENLIVNAKTIQNYSDGSLRKENSDLIYHLGKDYVLPSALTRIIVKHQQNALPFEHFVKFFENILKNPSKDSIMDLYAFLENNDLPITDDGCFLAYKGVDYDYKDQYSHTFDNHVGCIVRMSRDQVNPDRNQVCSYGLHVCSRSYLSGWSCGHIMLVKVNPKDVVAVPIDYNNAKMRVCEYTVINEVAQCVQDLDKQKLNEKAVYNVEQHSQYTDEDYLEEVLDIFEDYDEIESMNRDDFREEVNSAYKNNIISVNYYKLLKKFGTYKSIKEKLLEMF